MYFTKRLILLAFCAVSLGSATESQYLAYNIEYLGNHEFLDRQIKKNDKGYQIETDIETFHPVLDSSEYYNSSTDFQTKGHYSYSRKSVYY